MQIRIPVINSDLNLPLVEHLDPSGETKKFYCSCIFDKIFCVSSETVCICSMQPYLTWFSEETKCDRSLVRRVTFGLMDDHSDMLYERN